MAAKLRARLTYANILSTIAVIAALGGGGFAAARATRHRARKPTITVVSRNVTVHMLPGIDNYGSAKCRRREALTGGAVAINGVDDPADRLVYSRPGVVTQAGAQQGSSVPGAGQKANGWTADVQTSPGSPTGRDLIIIAQCAVVR